MENLNRNFGLVIAILLPGFVALGGIAPFSPLVRTWLSGPETMNFGAPLYALLAATAAGMVVSCFRWLLIDRMVHSHTGLGAPVFNARALEERPAAVAILVENHYRYAQFYGNTVVAIAWTYGVYRWLNTSPTLGLGTDLGIAILCAVLFAGSRDALSKYRLRIGQLVGQSDLFNMDGELMTNGIDHSQGSGASPKAPASPKSTNSSTPTGVPKPAPDKDAEAKLGQAR